MLRTARPVLETSRMPCMLTDHFLQKNDIGIKSPQILAQLVHRHVPLEMRKTFMNIIGGNMQLIGHVMNSRG